MLVSDHAAVNWLCPLWYWAEFMAAQIWAPTGPYSSMVWHQHNKILVLAKLHKNKPRRDVWSYWKKWLDKADKGAWIEVEWRVEESYEHLALFSIFIQRLRRFRVLQSYHHFILQTIEHYIIHRDPWLPPAPPRTGWPPASGGRWQCADQQHDRLTTVEPNFLKYHISNKIKIKIKYKGEHTAHSAELYKESWYHNIPTHAVIEATKKYVKWVKWVTVDCIIQFSSNAVEMRSEIENSRELQNLVSFFFGLLKSL